MCGNPAHHAPASDQYDTPAVGYGLNAACKGRRGGQLGGQVDVRPPEREHGLPFMNGAFTPRPQAGGKTLVAGATGSRPRPGPGSHRRRAPGPRAVHDAERIGAAPPQRHHPLPAPNRSDTVPTGRIGIRYAVNDAFYVRSAATPVPPPTLNNCRPFGSMVCEASQALKPSPAGSRPGRRRRTDPLGATVFYSPEGPGRQRTIGVGPGTSPAGSCRRAARCASVEPARSNLGSRPTAQRPSPSWSLARGAQLHRR